jgi:hypothetical protein
VAQWARQFSGQTHETRVADCEEALRTAAAALHGADPADQKRKAKNVRAGAKRLVSARRHLMKARLLGLEAGAADEAAAHQQEISSLRERLEALDAHGLEDVLVEFGVAVAGSAV